MPNPSSEMSLGDFWEDGFDVGYAIREKSNSWDIGRSRFCSPRHEEKAEYQQYLRKKFCLLPKSWRKPCASMKAPSCAVLELFVQHISDRLGLPLSRFSCGLKGVLQHLVYSGGVEHTSPRKVGIRTCRFSRVYISTRWATCLTALFLSPTC